MLILINPCEFLSNQSNKTLVLNSCHLKAERWSGSTGRLLIFPLELEISGVVVQRIYQNSKNDGFCEELLSENNFEAVLATLCWYKYGFNACEAVLKIATDQKDYHKCCSCVTVCWIVKIYQSITVQKGRLPTY